MFSVIRDRYNKHIIASDVRFIASIAILFILLSEILLALDHACYDGAYICTTWNNVKDGEDFDVLIMGNSHATTSFVPDIIEESTGLKCAILGSSGESMNTTLENFKTLLHYSKPKLIILEAYSTTKNGRPETVGKKSIGMPSFWDRISACVSILGIDDIPWCTFRIFCSEFRWSRWSTLVDNISDNKVGNRYRGHDVKGYQFKNSFTGGKGDIEVVEKKCREIYSDEDTMSEISDPVVAEAYVDFLNLAEQNGIPVIIVKTPTLTTNNCSAISKMSEIAEGYNCVVDCIDFHMEMSNIGLDIQDYYDESHLNRRGASKFTKYFLEQMIIPGQSKPNFSNVFAYDTEYIIPLDNGRNRFVMETYGENVQYCFYMDGKKIKDWSDDNFVDVDISIDAASRIRVVMLPEYAISDNKEKLKLSLNFMKQNDSFVDI